jgi:hypothetical protein
MSKQNYKICPSATVTEIPVPKMEGHFVHRLGNYELQRMSLISLIYM